MCNDVAKLLFCCNKILRGDNHGFKYWNGMPWILRHVMIQLVKHYEIHLKFGALTFVLVLRLHVGCAHILILIHHSLGLLIKCVVQGALFMFLKFSKSFLIHFWNLTPN